jgi:hypothetical protein
MDFDDVGLAGYCNRSYQIRHVEQDLPHGLTTVAVPDFQLPAS